MNTVASFDMALISRFQLCHFVKKKIEIMIYKKVGKNKQDLALMSHHRASVKNLSFAKSQKLQILNLSVSKCFKESFISGPKFEAKMANRFGVFV